jgi:cytosolic 5'-nucleotidase 3
MSSVHITDQAVVDGKFAVLQKGGIGNLHIVADFDCTLTHAALNGKRCTPSWEVFELTEQYRQEKAAQVALYLPQEMDVTLPLEVRKMKMAEWALEHLNSLIRAGLHKDMIISAVAQAKMSGRDGLVDLCQYTHQSKIPFLIFSAGLGDVISEFFRLQGVFFPNMHIISNFFTFDTEGKANGFKDEIIMGYAKSEVHVRGKPYEKEITSRRNVILLGDSMGDIDMAKGFPHDTILKIGFINGKAERLAAYSEVYDVVITEDGSLEYVLDIVQKLSKL